MGEATPARLDAALRSLRSMHGTTMARRGRTLLRGGLRLASMFARLSSSLAGVSPVRVAVRRPGSRLAAWSGNGSGRSPVSKALKGERLSGP